MVTPPEREKELREIREAKDYGVTPKGRGSDRVHEQGGLAGHCHRGPR